MSFPPRDNRNTTTTQDGGLGPQFDDTVLIQNKPKMSFGNLFRDIDLFGHQVSLNIGGRSSKHTTICGGLCTIAAFILIFHHMYYQILLIISGDLDRIAVQPFIRNSTEMSKRVNLQESNIGIFMYMYDTATYAHDINPLSTKYTDLRRQIIDPFDKDLELDRYINIEFVQYK
jgi:hypothetical protein